MRCKKCNAELIEFRSGDSVEYICPVCDEAPVAQAEELIEYDSNKYTIKIIAVEKYDKQIIKEVARICSCNYLDAKKILEETGKVFKPMDAIETRAMKKKIEKTGIQFVITPDFNW